MKYTNNSVRRKDRLLDKEKAIELLKQGDYGVLSMQTESGGAYGIPINYVWDGKHSVYLHCAAEGRKLRCIAFCNNVSFCVVGRNYIVPSQFTTAYESIILDCTAITELPVDERKMALELLLDKFSPDDKMAGSRYAEKLFERTGIIRLDIHKWTGKRNRIH